MSEFDGIEQLAAAFVREGMPEDRALDYAYLIGDVFQYDDEGRLMIFRDGQLIDRVPAPAGFQL